MEENNSEADQFFEALSSLVADVERRPDNNLEFLKINVDSALQSILNLMHDIGSTNSLMNLYNMFQVISHELFREIRGIDRNLAILNHFPNHPSSTNVGAGRPKYHIQEDTLINLRNLGYQWNEIAAMLLVSRWTIYRRVKELGIEELVGYSNITDFELDETIRRFMV